MTPTAPIDHLKLTTEVLLAIESLAPRVSREAIQLVIAVVEPAIYRHFHPKPKSDR
jgi:hypothetical protein